MSSESECYMVHMHICMHPHVHTHVHTYTHTCSHTHTSHTHTHHTHSHTHTTYTHAHTHTELTYHPFDVRLAGGSLPGTGRVEIFYGGVWGTVCDMLWDISDAQVVCTQLGYVGATTAVSPAVNGEGVIWMDQVSCHGNETRYMT